MAHSSYLYRNRQEIHQYLLRGAQTKPSLDLAALGWGGAGFEPGTAREWCLTPCRHKCAGTVSKAGGGRIQECLCIEMKKIKISALFVP
jgi:hypothetical protein